MQALKRNNTAAWFFNLVRSREASVVIVLVVISLLMFFSEQRSAFFAPENKLNLMRETALLAIFAIGETFVIITAGIDLSVGALIAFCGMLMAWLLYHPLERLLPAVAIPLAISLTLLVGLLIGWVHATLVHKLRLPAFVVTLASLLIFRSQALVINDQKKIPISDFPAISILADGALFEGHWFAIPIPTVIMLVIAIITGIILSKTKMGRYIYSLGCNESATRLSGVNVYKAKMFAYGVSALLGGIAGVLYTAYNGQADPQVATGYELDAVAASVIGGASLMGGRGTVLGTVLGAAVLQVIFSAINLRLQSPEVWRGTVLGGVLLFAVLVAAIQQKRSGQSES